MTDKLEIYSWPCSETPIRPTERDEWARLDPDGKLVFFDIDKCVAAGNNAFALLANGVWNAAIEEATKGADFVLQAGDRTLNDIIRGDEEINQEQRTAPRKLSFARAIEAMIAKAGEVMRDRCVKACTDRSAETDADDFDEWDQCNYSCAEAIRALPSVALEDLK